MSLDDTIESIFRRVAETTLREAIREDVRRIVREELRVTPAVAAAPLCEEYVTTKRAAKLVDVSEQSIRRWIGHGDLSSYRAGRLLRVRLQELKDFLARKTQTDTPDIDARARAILGESRGRRG